MMKTDNIFEGIPKVFDEEVVDLLAKSEHVRVERIVSKGHTAPVSGWYDQDENEWVIVLKGNAVISFENGGETNLEAGSHINIPAHSKHRVKWTDPEIETVWLTVRY